MYDREKKKMILVQNTQKNLHKCSYIFKAIL